MIVFLFTFNIFWIIIRFPFIEVDDNFDPPELMDDDVIDDYNDNAGNNVAEEAEVKCRIVQTTIKIKISFYFFIFELCIS